MNSNRRNESSRTRESAGSLAFNRPHPRHFDNGDELKFRHKGDAGAIACKSSHLMSFTKGLPHEPVLGLIKNPDDFQLFVRGVDTGDPRDFRDTPLGHLENCYANKCIPEWLGPKIARIVTEQAEDFRVNVRGWESQGAGLSFDLEGPDAQAVTMPPAPRLGSQELIAEMGEVYVQALLRDIPFGTFNPCVNKPIIIPAPLKSKKKKSQSKSLKTESARLGTTATFIQEATDCLELISDLDWFDGEKDLMLNPTEKLRRRNKNELIVGNAFRGITPGDDIGPYISQFLLAGNSGVNGRDEERSPADGFISYGAISIDQRVRNASEGVDYMTNWEDWLDVQNGADIRGFEEYNNDVKRRFIHTPRDLATYVHYDALYEAYLNACLLLLGSGVGFDPGIPFQAPDNIDHQQGFAHFGAAHILSLVTEVATRALKAVRFQKFNVHRRCRPEVLAARVYRAEALKHMAPELVDMREAFDNGLLEKIRTYNRTQNGVRGEAAELLPMAFCEGSPMHPSYGAGHATVAGACVTILKAFFDHKKLLNIVPSNEIINDRTAINMANRFSSETITKNNVLSANFGYISINNGSELGIVPIVDQNCDLKKMTVEGELNKLASNISIGRNWAGVHYFSDYYESILMGEQVALGILEEQKLTYNEQFSMTVPLFNGDTIRI